MKGSQKFWVAGLILSIAGIALADDQNLAQQMQQMKDQLQQQSQRIAAQDAQIQQMRAAQGDSWLTERRAEEVKSLIRDVLSDADTRASLAEGGMTAGYKDHFFLASEDGNFLLQISGQVQTRYTYNRAKMPLVAYPDDSLTFNNSDGSPVSSLSPSYDTNIGDQTVAGFDVRRAKIRFDGHLFDPKFTYAVQLSGLFRRNVDFQMQENDPNEPYRSFATGMPDLGVSAGGGAGGDIVLEDAWFAYEFADGWTVKVGQFKAPFLREEAVSSANQVAVERSFIADLYTIDYTQGIQVSYAGEVAGTPVRMAVMLHDGTYQANTSFDQDSTEFAFAGRMEVLLAGDWAQFDDSQAWSGQPMALMVGAAVDYEAGERGHNAAYVVHNDGGDDYFYNDQPNVTKWTVDATAKFPDMMGLTLFGAVVGQHINTHGSTQLVHGADQFGLVLQASVFVVPDKMDVFARWEYTDLDRLVYVNVPQYTAVDYSVVSPFSDSLNLFTFGGNYYFKGNAAKASVDVVWCPDEMPISDTGAGIRAAAGDDQVTIRAQFQFLF